MQNSVQLLRNDQTGINFLIIVHAFLFCLWLSLSMVSGFSIYVVDPIMLTSSGWAHSVSHIGWWAIIDFIVILISVKTPTFVLSASVGGRKLEYSVSKALDWIIFHAVCLCISVLADIVHIVLIILEITDNESVFVRGSFALLVCFLVGRIFEAAIIKLWLLARLRMYEINLKNVLKNTPSVLSL